MRVLMTTDAVGGVWTFTRELTLGLLDEGCTVALVCVGPAPSQQQSRWVQALRAARGMQFQFSALDVSLEWMQGNEAAFARAAPVLLRLVREFQPDIIHSSQFCFGALPALLPVVITAHSDVLSWAASSRSGPLEDSPWLRRYQDLVETGLNAAAAVVAPTQWMIQALKENFRLPADQRVVANGRDLPRVSASPRKLQAVTCGRLWDEGKNVQLLGLVSSAMPILVAGETAGEVSSRPLSVGSAMLVGKLPEAELLKLLRQSAIYLCTSRYEPFGLAPVEAALCGCAVLANDIASLREVWGDAALYFSDAASLSALLLRLSADPDLLTAAQIRSHNRALQYTRTAMTSKYLTLYREQTRAREIALVA